MQETRVQSLSQADLLEKDVAVHPIILAWRIPYTEEPGGLQFMGSQRVKYDWATNTITTEQILLLLLIFFSSVTQSCPTLCDPIDRLPYPSPTLRVCSNSGSTSWWCHPISSPSVIPFSLVLSLSQHQGLFKWVSSLHQMAKVLELQSQHQSFQWILRTDFL